MSFRVTEGAVQQLNLQNAPIQCLNKESDSRSNERVNAASSFFNATSFPIDSNGSIDGNFSFADGDLDAINGHLWGALGKKKGTLFLHLSYEDDLLQCSSVNDIGVVFKTK